MTVYSRDRAVITDNFAMNSSDDASHDYPMVWVELPETLKGDPKQLKSIPREGSWIHIGFCEIPYQIVQDPELSELDDFRKKNFFKQARIKKEIDSGDRPNWIGSASPEGLGYSFLIGVCSIGMLGKEKEQSISSQERIIVPEDYQYKIVREQRYEFCETFLVYPQDELMRKYTVTVGTQNSSSKTFEDTTGFLVGAELNALLRNETSLGVKLKASGFGEADTQNKLAWELGGKLKGEISKSLKISEVTTKIVSETITREHSYTAYGGTSGFRYVVWQIVDRFQLIRDFDKKIISEHRVYSHTELLQYPLKHLESSNRSVRLD